MTTRITLFAAMCAALMMLSNGCESEEDGKTCTLIGCADSYAIDFVRAGAWPAGDYEVAVDLDGSGVTCTVALPYADCNAEATCVGDKKANMLLGLSGCALDKAEHKLSGVSIVNLQPKSVSVTVKRGKDVLGTATYTPTFTTSRPNGPGCDPECTTAPGEKLSLK